MRRERKSSPAADPAAHMFLSPAGPAQCPKWTPAPFPLRLPRSRHRALAPSRRELTDVEASACLRPYKAPQRPLGFPPPSSFLLHSFILASDLFPFSINVHSFPINLKPCLHPLWQFSAHWKMFWLGSKMTQVWTKFKLELFFYL